MKIIISSYACSPYQGSEAAVGWGYISSLSKYHELCVIVEKKKFKSDIIRFCHENPHFSKKVKFYFISKTRNKLLRKLWPPSYYYYYRKWHIKAYHLSLSLHKKYKFDLSHQLTMVGFREPGFLWKIPIPFVWGPVGGMGYFPLRFLYKSNLYTIIYYLFYNSFNYIQMKYHKRSRLAAKYAGSGLFFATNENRIYCQRYWNLISCPPIAEIGLPSINLNTPNRRSKSKPLNIIWSGSHIPRKALHIALYALSKVPMESNWHLDILGTGSLTQKLKKLSVKLNINNKITFHDWIPRDLSLQVMQRGHLMLITSLRDLSSTVSVEALAQGLPIICFDHCGFSDIVNENCGIKIKLSTFQKSINDFSHAISKIESNEPLRYKLALGAIERSLDFSWSKKVELVNKIYSTKVSKYFHENSSGS